MKKILAFIRLYEPNVSEEEVKKAYKRESSQFGIGRGSDAKILEYLRLNKLI